MVVVGITGGIGSGKGLATEFFRARGAAIVDADEVARELMQSGSPIVAEIAAVFGRHLLREDGSLDRRKLGEAVFGDREDLANLNAITHPPIKAEIDKRIYEVGREGRTRVLCLVAPLLLEAGYRDTVDRLLVMAADQEERVHRVMERDGLTEREVRQRIAAQMSPAEQARQADWVVDTTEGREAARRQLEAVWDELNR